MKTQEEILIDQFLTEEEIGFTYKKYFIFIQEHSEGGYDGSVYSSKEDYENEEDCLDGGVCESLLAFIAINFFKEIADDLELKEMMFDDGFIVGSN